MRSVLRCSFSKFKGGAPLGNFLSASKESYDAFLYGGSDDPNSASGVLKTFLKASDAYGYADVEFVSAKLKKPTATPDACRRKLLSYASEFYATVRLIVYDIRKDDSKRSVRYVLEKEVYLCDFPLMIGDGIFIINGIEKVVVSQIKRAPGVFFSKKNKDQKNEFVADIRPYFGNRIEFIVGGNKFDCKIGTFSAFKTIDLLRALCIKDDEIVSSVFEKISLVSCGGGKFSINSETKLSAGRAFFLNIRGKNGEVFFKAGSVLTKQTIRKIANDDTLFCELDDLCGSYLYKSVGGLNSAHLITEEDLSVIDIKKGETLELINVGSESFSQVLLNDLVANRDDADDNQKEERSLFRISSIIRESEPFVAEEAKRYLNSILFSEERFNLMPVGRARMNDVLGLNLPKDLATLTVDDLLATIRCLLLYRNGAMYVDDVDSLTNRRVCQVGEIVCGKFRDSVQKVAKSIVDKLNGAVLDNVSLQELVPTNIVAKTIKDFFLLSDLCQFMEQTNLLSEITHLRKVTALGEGGINRESATAEIRDIHSSHYGRICPIETPDGHNIGLVVSLACYARVDEFGFVKAPYRRVSNGNISDEIIYLSAGEERRYKIGYIKDFIANRGNKDAKIVARFDGDTILASVDEIDFIDVATCQITSMMSSFIPFVESNDIARALMGCNMQRQAVPLLFKEQPFVATGAERSIGYMSSSVVKSNIDGEVVYADAENIIVKGSNGENERVVLKTFKKTNQDTFLNQSPVVGVGDLVKKGDILADCSSTKNGEVSIGKNILIGFLPWNGYNYEDSVVISNKLVQEDKFTSVHIVQYEISIRDTQLGEEQTTNDINGIPFNKLKNLDENGVIHIGSNVKAGDILVGRVTPVGEKFSSSEDRLLQAMFNDNALSKKDTSLYVPVGISGTVIDVDILTKRGELKDSTALLIEEKKIRERKKMADLEIKYLDDAIKDKNSKEYKVARSKIENSCLEDVGKIMDGDLLPNGVLKIVKVFVAIKSRLQPGDKIAGRHGNKGVISRCVAVEDMPYLEDGTPLDLVFSPVSIPGRMNIGQVLETHLGFLSYNIGKKIDEMMMQKNAADKVRKLLKDVSACDDDFVEAIDKMSDNEVVEFGKKCKSGLYYETPVFDGAKVKDMENVAEALGIDSSLQVKLYNGLTGEPFDRKVTIGYMYIIKLHHLVDEKIHMRSTGPYSLITQQPLGGRAYGGGQRFGEMECWALQAYGAAYSLQEMLTVKSDDINGRRRMYESIIDGGARFESGVPESFNVLCREFRSLGFDVELGLISE